MDGAGRDPGRDHPVRRGLRTPKLGCRPDHEVLANPRKCAMGVRADPRRVSWQGLSGTPVLGERSTWPRAGSPVAKQPPHPGGAPHCGPHVIHEAYSHEVSSAGYWPGPDGEGSFYSCIYPSRPVSATPSSAPPGHDSTTRRASSCWLTPGSEQPPTPTRPCSRFCKPPTTPQLMPRLGSRAPRTADLSPGRIVAVHRPSSEPASAGLSFHAERNGRGSLLSAAFRGSRLASLIVDYQVVRVRSRRRSA